MAPALSGRVCNRRKNIVRGLYSTLLVIQYAKCDNPRVTMSCCFHRSFKNSHVLSLSKVAWPQLSHICSFFSPPPVQRSSLILNISPCMRDTTLHIIQYLPLIYQLEELSHFASNLRKVDARRAWLVSPLRADGAYPAVILTPSTIQYQPPSSTPLTLPMQYSMQYSAIKSAVDAISNILP